MKTNLNATRLKEKTIQRKDHYYPSNIEALWLGEGKPTGVSLKAERCLGSTLFLPCMAFWMISKVS